MTLTSKRSGKIVAIVIMVILVLIVSLISIFYFMNNQNVPKQFDYKLSIYPTKGTVEQANNITTSINVIYVNGSTEPVNLTAFGGPDGTIYNLSKQNGTPSSTNVFNSQLTIKIPTSAPSSIYTINVTSSALNSKTYSIQYQLTVLNAKINVSGKVTANANIDIFPTEVEFVNTSNNSTYSTSVHTTSGSTGPGGLIQSGTYSISLPNQQNYRVICTWALFTVASTPSSDMGMGTFGGPNLFVNGEVGVTSMTANFSD